MAYDRMDWHYGGQFPKDLPNEAGGTHIGMYMAWAFSRGKASDELREDAVDELAQLTQRRCSPWPSGVQAAESDGPGAWPARHQSRRGGRSRISGAT